MLFLFKRYNHNNNKIFTLKDFSFLSTISFVVITRCHEYGITAMNVLALALALTHFDITVNKTSCFRSKIRIQDIKLTINYIESFLLR